MTNNSHSMSPMLRYGMLMTLVSQEVSGHVPPTSGIWRGQVQGVDVRKLSHTIDLGTTLLVLHLNASIGICTVFQVVPEFRKVLR